MPFAACRSGELAATTRAYSSSKRSVEPVMLGLTISQKNPPTISKRLAAIASMMATSLKNTDLRMAGRRSYSVKATSDEYVTSPSHSTNKDRLFRIISEFLPNAAHQNVDRAVVSFPIDASRLVHDAIATEDPASISREQPQQFELRSGLTQVVPSQTRRAVHPAHFQLADSQNVFFLGVCAPSQYRLDTRHEFAWFKWLGHIIVRA